MPLSTYEHVPPSAPLISTLNCWRALLCYALSTTQVVKLGCLSQYGVLFYWIGFALQFSRIRDELTNNDFPVHRPKLSPAQGLPNSSLLYRAVRRRSALFFCEVSLAGWNYPLAYFSLILTNFKLHIPSFVNLLKFFPPYLYKIIKIPRSPFPIHDPG